MKTHRVHKSLIRRKKKKPWRFHDAPDPRQQKKVTHPMEHILDALLLGLLSGHPSLRDVEQMLRHDLGSWGHALVPKPISDTTLDTEVRRLDTDYLHRKLVAQVRDAYRSKELAPVGLPCGVATVDGKNLATLKHDAGGRAQPRSSVNEKWHLRGASNAGKSYYLVPVLRAALTSAEARPAIAQVALGLHEGESSAFGRMVEQLHHTYGRSGMIGIIDADAGLTSLANANLIDKLGYGYVFGLKGNQPDLFAEAKTLLEPMAAQQAPEAETPWQVRGGKRIRRRLWRTPEMQGIQNSVGTWHHLRQVWLVRQETKDNNGKVETEDRYFISSELWNHLKPAQILILVRNHWAIENDVFNSLDLQWHEDAAPWCTKDKAVWALGLLRLMAYNFVQNLRRRRLRPKDADGRRKPPMAWRTLFELVRRTLYVAEIEPLVTTPGA